MHGRESSRRVTFGEGDGDKTLTLGKGNNTVRVGDGNNAIVSGGTSTIEAGDGSNLIVAGRGSHTALAGDGGNILIDGSVVLTQRGDTLREVLDDWIAGGETPSNVASIRSRLAVTFNKKNANTLRSGSGLDWFWWTYAQNSTNQETTDLHN